MVEKLIKRCIDGDRKSQKELYYLHLTKLKSVSLRYSSNDALAKDALQNAFVRIFKSLAKVDMTKESIYPWMRKIVINEALRIKRPIPTISLEENGHHLLVESKIDSALNTLATQDLIKVIDQLPDKYKLVFQLKEIEGFSHVEITKMLDISHSASRSLLSRAKSKLKNLIVQYYSIIPEKLHGHDEL